MIFNEIIELIYKKSPLQKKRIEKYLTGRDAQYFQRAEDFAANYIGYLQKENISIEYAIDAYLKMCNNMMKSQVKFMRTGCYPVKFATDTFSNIYINEKEMKSYMIGLAISQYLWATHYDIYIFFEDYIKNNKEHISSYLEIGPGHDLFLNKAMDYIDNKAKITVIDISPISIDITKSIIKYFKPLSQNITYHNSDILEFQSTEKYNFITMGEVLEHVNFPEKLLSKINGLLTEKGKLFISTCVNCPAIDHDISFQDG